jgi:hypothetical protein
VGDSLGRSAEDGEIFQYMQTLGAAMGVAPPPALFAPPPPPQFSTPVSMKVLVMYILYFFVSHLQSLLCTESIGDIK